MDSELKLGALLLRKWKVRSRLVSKPARRHVGPRSSPKSRLPVVRSDIAKAKVAVAPTQCPAARLIRPDEALRQASVAFLLDQRSEHTRRAYGRDLKRFIKFLLVREFEKNLGDLDRALVVSFKEYLLRDGLQETTVDRHLATLRSFFGWLVEEGILEKNPAQAVRLLRPKRLSTTVGFTDDEVRRVLLQPDLHHRAGALHHAVLMVLFYCGIRRAELVSLRTTSLGVEHGHAVIRLRGKGNRERVIPLIQPVQEAILHYFRITGKLPGVDQPLFSPIRNNRTGTRDKPLDGSLVFYIVRKYARLAGVANRVSPHSCRATAISNARDRNVPDRAIQEFAGWASPDMITRYDKRKTAVEKSAAHSIRYGRPGEGPATPEAPIETLSEPQGGLRDFKIP